MATTQNLQLTLLTVGQMEKEVTINTNFQSIDQKVIKYLGELGADPSVNGVAIGSTYFNTVSNKIHVLKSTGAWAPCA